MTLRRGSFVLLLLVASGCATIAPPRLLHPGTAEVQRRRAELFDPYPATDVGPDIYGGRPTEYEFSPPENERAQNEAAFLNRYRQPPPPGLYRQNRPNSARQGVLYTPPPINSQPPGVYWP